MARITAEGSREGTPTSRVEPPGSPRPLWRSPRALRHGRRANAGPAPGRSCSKLRRNAMIESAGGERTSRREATLRYLITR
jgi:hypothetical protein